MAIIGVWKCALIGLGPQGEAIVNTFFFGPDGADAAVTAVAVANSADTVLAANFAPLVTSDWHYFKTQVLCVHGTNIGKAAESSASAPLVGGLGAGSGPLDICCIVKRKADGIGKHSRGRLYISPILATMVDVDGRMILPGGYDANVQTLIGATITPGASTFVQCLWDKAHTQALAILTATEALISGIQKRRRLRLPN